MKQNLTICFILPYKNQQISDTQSLAKRVKTFSLLLFFFSCFLTSLSLYPLPHLHRLVTRSTKQVKLDRPTMHTYNYKIHHSTTFGPIMEAPNYINKCQFHNLGAYSLTIKFQKNILSGTSDLEHT